MLPPHKSSLSFVAWDVPLAFPDSLSIFLFPVAGCMRLTSGDCINRLAFLVASRWAGQWEHQQEVRERRTVKQEYWFLQPLLLGTLQRDVPIGQFPAPQRQTSFSQALISNNYFLQPEMGNTASLAWSNYTLPRVFSILCLYL